MTEQERSQLLFKTEAMLLRRKINETKDKELQQQYGASSVAVRRDNTMLLMNIDEETETGICCCGRPVDITDEPIYCRYCGQRVSGKFGWTANNYWGEK